MSNLLLEDVILPRNIRRHECLPAFRRVRTGLTHPLRAHCFAGSRVRFTDQQLEGVRILPETARTYVYQMESTVQAIKKRHRESRDIRFDKPMAAGLLDKGFIRLKPGDAVFARPAGGNADGTNDVLQVIVLGDGQLFAPQVDALRRARDEILGPVNERGPSVPSGGVGGTAFERSGYADPIEKGARAYSVLTSEQRMRGRVIGPGKAYKVRPEHRHAPGPKMRVNALKAAVAAGVAAAKYLPVAYQDALRVQADLVNAPRFGCDDNYLFSSVQVNIARPVPFEQPGQALKDLGSFGVPHIDIGDMPEGFTSVQSVSDLPATIDPGQFVVHELGVFIDLQGTVVALFRGVQYHGGCAPRPRNRAVVIPDSAYRIVFVTYPKAAVYLGLGTYILGSLRTVKSQTNRTVLSEGSEEEADNEVEVDRASGTADDVSRRYLTIGPDILNNPQSKAQESWIAHPNFARDTWDIMAAVSVVTFFVRSLYLLVVFAMRQLRDVYQVQIDATKFFSAFSYVDANGDRQTLRDWPNAPHINDPIANQRRESAAAAWKDFSAHVTQVIPFSVIQQDTRAKTLAKGKPVPRIFDIHDVQAADGVDGAERHRGTYFRLVKRFNAVTTKRMPVGPASSASEGSKETNGSESSTDNSSDNSSDNSTNSDTSNSFASQSGVGTSLGEVRNLRRSRRQLLLSSTSRGLSDNGHSSEECPQPPRKKPRTRGRVRRLSSTSSSANSEPKAVSVSRPDTPAATDGESPELEPLAAPDPKYEQWLHRVLAGHPIGASNLALVDTFRQPHTPPVTRLVYDVNEGTLCQPWGNPLNGPVTEWCAGRSPCDDMALVPDFACRMFSVNALNDDFWLAYRQSTTILPDYAHSLEKLPAFVAQAVSSSSSLEVEGSLLAVASAWQGLDGIRTRLAKDNIFERASTVVLMAYEALLCGCIESLATAYCRLGVVGDSQLSALSATLWDRMSTGSGDGRFNYTLNGRSHTIDLPVTSRSLRSDFDRQRAVYRVLFDIMANRVGVTDSGAFRLRAWIVLAVVDVLGFDALYHSMVWSSWQYPFTRILNSRSTKDPTLDVLLPFVGRLGASNLDPPVSALATLSLAVCTPEDRARALDAAQLTVSFFQHAVKFRTRSTNAAPPETAVVYRSLAVMDRLIGLPYDSSGTVDVSGIHTILLHGVEVPLLPDDKALLQEVALNPDLRMPFRYHAPSAQSLRHLFRGMDANVMRTDIGLRNVVATRYITYNAQFLLSGEQRFASRVQDLLDAFARKPLRPKGYFLVDKIYGRNQSRYMDRLPAVWDSCSWPENLGRSFYAVWRAFAYGVNKEMAYKIPNVGPLLSLQICGDYYVAGHLDEPTVLQMGEIVFKINSGGVKGLCLMGFLSDGMQKRGAKSKHELGAVQDAFSRYYDWTLSAISPDERLKWKWSVVTAENHLCKHSRLVMLVNHLKGDAVGS